MKQTNRRHPGSQTRAASAQRLTPLETAILAVVATALIYAALSGNRSHPVDAEFPTITVRVRPADTLWSVATNHRIDGLDTAETVRVIQDINDMDTASLATGQVLVVPATPEHTTALAALD